MHVGPRRIIHPISYLAIRVERILELIYSKPNLDRRSDTWRRGRPIGASWPLRNHEDSTSDVNAALTPTSENSSGSKAFVAVGVTRFYGLMKRTNRENRIMLTFDPLSAFR